MLMILILKMPKLLGKVDMDKEFFPCYGAYQILSKGFISEAIGVPSRGKNNKRGIFTRIFNIFS